MLILLEKLARIALAACDEILCVSTSGVGQLVECVVYVVRTLFACSRKKLPPRGARFRHPKLTPNQRHCDFLCCPGAFQHKNKPDTTCNT